MATVSQSIEIGAKAGKIYSQCLRFEEFPQFMQGVREVRQISHNRLYWRAEAIGHDPGQEVGQNQEVEWEAEIEEQLPDQRISWHCTVGASDSGSLELESLEENKTRVRLELALPSPEQVPPGQVDRLTVLRERIQAVLERLKEHVEKQNSPPWHCQIEEGQVGRVKDYP